MEKLASTYSCRRKCIRWPLTLFFNIIDVAGIAAFIIHIYNNQQLTRQRCHRSFLSHLGKQLVHSHIQNRIQNPQAIQKNAKESLRLLGYTAAGHTDERIEQSVARRRCVLCPREVDRKIKTMYTVCNRNICKEHSTPGVMCQDCF